ncbi:MAG: cobaltochelatase subunit CobN [Moorea sp. SIOASIH]|uniref:cobaltochelatase subunit CobN n=1 Tax=Moorena sp. SIOASIH TaxID=2607817 RepID=UPI0013BC67C4|nr:cobaltochelatase subunit CobN [Moorena sp. SIOASIH]NEO37916.1 cobaltochelatase subunit CobN [Moorena sp. SIOASIH]
MHRIAATPGGWNPEAEGVIFIEQTPAPIIFLTAADTDIQTLAASVSQLPPDFPAIRVANLLQLQQQLTIDTYAEDILAKARIIIIRLLGGRSYWSYGLEVLKETVEQTGARLLVLPGDDRPDPTLTSHSTETIPIVNQLWRYFTEGGVENFTNALKFVADVCLEQTNNPPAPKPVPRVGVYPWQSGIKVNRLKVNRLKVNRLKVSRLKVSRLKVSRLKVSRLKVNRLKVSRLKVEGWEDKQQPNNLPEGNAKGEQPTLLERQRRTTKTNLGLSATLREQPSTFNQTTFNQNQPSTKQPSTKQPSTKQPSTKQPSTKQPSTFNQNKPSTKQPTGNLKVGILFYRAHYLAGNTAPIDGLCQALVERGLEPVPVFVSSLRDLEVQRELLGYFQNPDSSSSAIAVLLNTTSFSVAKLDAEVHQLELWERLDVPVLQVILSSGTVEQWESGFQGLMPRDTAMNVALPEVDGRIISRAISFKSAQRWNPALETDVVVYEPVCDRIQFVADLAMNWLRLGQTLPNQRRVALILANYPNRDGRLANGVGLDTPASCVEILKGLRDAGYWVERIPETGDELIEWLTAGVTNDPEGWQLRLVRQELSWQEYWDYFQGLPIAVQKGIRQRWGEFDVNGKHSKDGKGEITEISGFPISGIQLGNVFVGIQPSRGYDLDPALNYHAPDLEPTDGYLAFYYWLRKCFGAQAIVHVGKHGNLEWLPGKSVALSECCYPEVALTAMPHLYPFIVNDPGEGAQAKRRAQGVIIDHLTPPMTRAELYGPLQQLEGLVDEYYEAQSLDLSRLPIIRVRIVKLIIDEHLHEDLGIAVDDIEAGKSEITNQIDAYLCELKEAQIRDGLHVFSQCPQGRQLQDLIVAIARHPGKNRIGLTRALAQDLGWDFDPLTEDFSVVKDIEKSKIDAISKIIKRQKAKGKRQKATEECYSDRVTVGDFKEQAKGKRQKATEECYSGKYTVGDLVEVLEEEASELVKQINSPLAITDYRLPISQTTKQELDWIRDRLLPALQETNQELTQLLRGLDGRYVPSGPSGAPTRGRPDVLPTGRNFYSVDIRAIPTETAWDVGRKAAEVLVERYTQENGEYPKTLGISVWGTSTMRTGGDDISEALALLGVRPIWDGSSRRVIDFEILPVSVLQRPRVDVTLRISGFFRDSFPNLIDLFHNAVVAVASLDESPSDNPLAAQVKQETDYWLQVGLSQSQAQMRSHYRIFGSKPGAYGAGLQGLIESQNWQDEQDLARAYINWSSYAYSSSSPKGAPEAFEQRLKQMQVVLHNQDNREHDLLDSDDYYQFQGGLTVAVRGLTGKNPQTYFGDNSIPEKPKVRQLKEEIARVYRSRVVNPKWIEGVMRHGYKGAFEMAATVDYLFAYDATANCVADHMYQGVAQGYLFDSDVQEFVQQKNPWALRDMAERLLEANQRGLWQSVAPETLEKLRAIALQAEAVIEGENFGIV